MTVSKEVDSEEVTRILRELGLKPIDYVAEEL